MIKGVMKTGQMKLVILSGKKVERLNVYGPLATQQKYSKFNTQVSCSDSD
jgi:hypothetical protein